MPEKKTILLVEDEPVIRLSEAKALKQEGYRVIAVPTGEKAIKIVGNNGTIDLILMDINLGKGMDGAEAAEKILKDCDIPVLFLSSYTEKDVTERIERISSYGYVVKDSGIAVLNASIKMALKLHEAHMELMEKERMLKKSEEQYHNMFTHMVEGHAVHEIILDEAGNPSDYRFLEINPAFERLTGLSEEAVIGRTAKDVLPDIEPIWIERFGAVALTGSPMHFEQYNRDLQRHYEVSAYSPAPHQFACSFTDITLRKKSEEALRQSEKQHRLMAESIQDVFWMATPGIEKMLYVSPAYERIWGRSCESLYAHPLSFIEAIHPEDRRRVLDTLENSQETAWSCTYRVVHPDGSIRWVEDRGFPVFDDQGLPYLKTGIVTDVTDRVMAEDSMACLAAIVDSSEDAIIGKSLDGTIISWNRGAERLYGYTSKEALGQSISFLVPPELHKDLSRVLAKVRRGRSIRLYDVNRRRKDGMIISVSLGISPVLNSRSEIIGMSTIARDITDAKRMAESVRTSQEKFLKAFNASPASTCIVTMKDSRYVEVNTTFQRMWGYKREEAVGRSVVELKVWLGVDQWEYVRRVFADQGRIRELELRLRAKTGEERTVLLSVEPIEVGNEPCMLLVAMDMSDHARAVEALRRANAYNKGLMEARPDTLVVIGPHGKITDANAAAEQMTGRSRDELLGADFADYFTDPEKARAAYKMALREGLVRDCFLDLKSSGGRVASVLYNASVCWDEDGEFIGVVAATHDITYRKQAEARLKESEERYRTAIEHSNDGVVIVQNGRHVYVNQKFLEMFGFGDPSELIGDATHKGVHPDDRGTVMEYFRRRQRGEPAPSRYTFRGIRKDGEEFFVEASVSSTMFRGEPASLAYLRDVTERKRMEEEKLYSAKLESALEMAGTICHELNQPLQVISSYSDILLAENIKDTDTTRRLEAIKAQTDRMGAITKKLVGVKQYSTRDYIGTIKIIDIDAKPDGSGA